MEETKKAPPTIEEQQKAEHQKKLERRKDHEDTDKQGPIGTPAEPASAMNPGVPVQAPAVPPTDPVVAPPEPPKPE